MTDADARALAAEYGRSLYDVRFDPRNKVRGSTVPKVSGQALIEAMWQNVTEARAMRDRVRARWEEAERQGLFDPAVLVSVRDEKAREAIDKAINVLSGDRTRCLSDLAHWRSWYKWASESNRPAAREPGSDDE